MIGNFRLSGPAKAAAMVVGAVMVVSTISAKAAVSFSDGAGGTITGLTAKVIPWFVGKDSSNGVARWMEAQDTTQKTMKRGAKSHQTTPPPTKK